MEEGPAAACPCAAAQVPGLDLTLGQSQAGGVGPRSSLSPQTPLLPRWCAQRITDHFSFTGVQLVQHVPPHLSALQGGEGLRAAAVGKKA